MELNYISERGSALCLGDQCRVELWDFSKANDNRDSRIEAATLVSTACYQKDTGLNKIKLYNEFVNRCQTPLEFIREPSQDPWGWVEHAGIGASLRNIDFPTRDSIHYDTDRDRALISHSNHIACFRLRIPLEVVGHIVRHRSFSFMQTSRRFTKVSRSEFYMPTSFTSEEIEMLEDTISIAMTRYNTLLNRGVKPEVARVVLPAYALLTTLWVMGETEGLLNFFKLRIQERAQFETKRVAKAMWTLLDEHQPGLAKNIVNNLPVEEDGV